MAKLITKKQKEKLGAIINYIIHLGGFVQALVYLKAGLKYLYYKAAATKPDTYSWLFLVFGALLAGYFVFGAFKVRIQKVSSNLYRAFIKNTESSNNHENLIFGVLVIIFPLTTLFVVFFTSFLMMDARSTSVISNFKTRLIVPRIILPAVIMREHQK